MGRPGPNTLDLVIDVGNHRTKTGLFHNGLPVQFGAINTGDTTALRTWLGDRTPTRIAIGSVAREAGWDAELGKIAPVTLLSGTSPSPLINDYETPGTLGVDRLANAVAAWRMFPSRNSMAIDLGSCITFDLVDRTGRYLGGVISPGMHMRGRAMHAFSARLPEADLDGPVRTVGTSTMGSLVSGIHEGIRHEMEGWIAGHRQRSPDLAVVLTGGDALRFARALKSGIFADPSLTLRGLHALLYHSNPAAGADPLRR